LDWFSPENPKPVGYINHQQQTTNTSLTNKFRRKIVTRKKIKNNFDGALLETRQKMQKLAEDKQNKPASSRARRRHKNQVEKQRKSETKPLTELRQSLARVSPELAGEDKICRPTTTEYASQPPQNTQANTQNTQKKKNKIIFFFSQEGVPVTIKQEQNSTMEFFEGTTPVWAVLPPIREKPNDRLSKNRNKLSYHVKICMRGKEMEVTASLYYSSLLKHNTNITIYRLNPNDLKTKIPLKP
jgi:hypothetical protein